MPALPHHTLVGVVAAVATVVLPLAVIPAPVDAAAPARSRVVTVRGKEPRPGRFVMVGSVTPRYHYKKVVILEQPGGAGPWRVAGVVKSDGKGIFATDIHGPGKPGKLCWSARVPATPGYRASAARTRACVSVG